MPFGTNDEVIFGHNDEVIDDKTASLSNDDADLELENKIKKYKENPLQVGKDVLSLDLPVGLVEQIPAGIQAGLGVVSGLGNYVTSGAKPGAYEEGKHWFSGTGASKVLTPRTKSGQAIAGGIGAALENFGEFYDRPENVKAVLGSVPVIGSALERSPEAIAGSGALLKAAPDILGLSGGVASLKALKPRGAKEAVSDVGSKLDILDEAKIKEPFGKNDEIISEPQGELLPSRAPQYGVSDTITGDHWVKDENGIPIRGDLSLEAQQLQNPLQRNLWGDELARKSEQEGIPLTEAIDKMPDLPWKDSERDIGLGLLHDEILASPELLKATDVDTPTLVLPKEPSSGIGSPKMGFNRGQRGGLDIKELTDAISSGMKHLEKYTNDLSKIDISKIAPKEKDDYARMIPGMGKATEGIIPRPNTAETIIANGLKGKDIPEIRPDIQMGPELAGEKYRNPVVSGVSSWLQWADKKYDYASKTLVRPVEHMIATIDNKSKVDLSEVLKREMFRREQYTPDELKAAGLSNKLINSYTELRNSFDTVYELQKTILERQGRKAPTKQEAYLASIRGGNYHIPVKDSNGNTAWHIQVRSKYDAKKAIDWLKENVKDIDKNLKIEYRPSNTASGIPKDILGGFQDLMNLVDEGSDASLAIKEAIRDAQEKAGYTFRGQSNRFLEKANIRGFEGDMPWLSPKENAARLLQNQIDYLNNSYKWAYMNDALGEVKNILADENLIKQQPNATSYVKDVVRQQLGLQDHFTRNAEEYVMHSMGLSGSHLNYLSSKLGRGTSLLQLGASLGYMIATPLTALYSVGMHMREGTLGMKPMSLAIADFSAGIVNNIMHESGKKARLPMTELGKEALKYAEDNGVITKNMFGDLDRVDRNPTASTLLGAYETTITVPEKIQRLSTFMSFVHGLKESGKYDNMYELFKRAETLTNIAATNFRSTELPMGVQKFGALGTAAFKYKAPILNYYHQLHMHGIDAAKGNVKPLAAMLGITAVLGGIQNLPGVNEIDGAWNLFKKAVANFSPENYNKVKDVDVKDFIRQNAGEAAAYGAVQTALGAQMNQRFGTDMVNIEDPLKNAFPVAGSVGSMADAAASLGSGNLSQAAWDVAPQTVRGNLEARDPAFRGLQPNSFRKPSDISNPDIQQIRTPEDIAYRKLGLRSAEEAKRLETQAMVNKEQQRINTALDGTMEKLVNAATKKDQDKTQTYARAWLQLNPDQSQFESALNSKLSKATLSPEQRDIIKANTIMAAQKVQKLIDARK